MEHITKIAARLVLAEVPLSVLRETPAVPYDRKPIEVGITRPDVIYKDTRTGLYYTNPVLEGGKPVTITFRNGKAAEISGGNGIYPEPIGCYAQGMFRPGQYSTPPAGKQRATAAPLPGLR